MAKDGSDIRGGLILRETAKAELSAVIIFV
jgi:hypothetical protein